MKEKSVTFCLLKLKAKEKCKCPQNHRRESDFSVEHLALFFQRQCLLTQLPAEAVAME